MFNIKEEIDWHSFIHLLGKKLSIIMPSGQRVFGDKKKKLEKAAKGCQRIKSYFGDLAAER